MLDAYLQGKGLERALKREQQLRCNFYQNSGSTNKRWGSNGYRRIN